MKLVEASTVFIPRYYGTQRSAVTKNMKIMSFPKREGNVSFENLFMQCVCLLSLSRAKITKQTERKSLTLFTLKTPIGKRMEWSAARRVLNVKSSVCFRITVAKSTSKSKLIFKEQAAGKAERLTKQLTASIENLIKNYGSYKIRQKRHYGTSKS